jgi:hypothetical protein
MEPNFGIGLYLSLITPDDASFIKKLISGVTKMKGFILALVLGVYSLTMQVALAQGTTGLLGVTPGFPQVAAGSGQQCSYDSGTLTITSLHNLYLPDSNTSDQITAGMLTLTATLDLAGNVTSGSITLNGTTTGGLSDPLLTGNLVAIGLEDTSPLSGGIDHGDFRVTPTGGSIFTGPDWPAGIDLTGSFNMTNSTYAGTLDSNWICVGASPTLGAELFPIDINNYIGQQQATAEANIVADNLTVGAVTLQTDAAPIGEVIGQNPVACMACAIVGDPVNLIVSQGPADTDGNGGGSGSSAMDFFILAGLFFLALFRALILSGDRKRN